jgi:murein hydrolase activator
MSLKRFFVLFMFTLVASSAFAQSSAELRRRREALNREIELLRRDQNKISSDKRLSIKQINSLNAQIRLREEKIGTINTEIRVLDSEISENTSTVRSLQTQLNRLKSEYAAMVLFAFRNQSAYSKLMFIFASRDFNQAYKRLKYLQQFGEYRKKQARYIEQTSRELGIRIVQLDRNKKEKNVLLHDQESEKQTLGKEKNNKAVVLSKLTKEERTIRSQVDQKRKEMARLDREIRLVVQREIAEERRKAELAAKQEAARTGTTVKAVPKGTSVLAATPESAKMSSDFLSNRGKLPWPVEYGTVGSGFGNATYGVNVHVSNNGADIVTKPGATVRAVFAGEVRRVIAMQGQGTTVMIRHGEYFTIYSKLKSANVSVGQKVSTKQTIGTVLTDAVDGTTELHFELWKASTPQNPQSWLAN